MLSLRSLYSAQDSFTRALALSILFHLSLVIFFLVKLALFTKPVIDLSQAISVNISESAPSNKLPEKIQPAALPSVPEKTLEKNTTEKTPKVPVKEEISISKAKTKQKQALEKIKQLSAIDKIKQDVTDETAKENSKSKAKKVYKNRVLAAGSNLTGLDKIEAGEYLQLLDAGIKQAWTLPQWLSKKKLKAQVLVKFNTLGQIIMTKLLLSSGNSSYDNYCIQAITTAAPFPKVPDKFSEKFSIDGLIVGFPE